MSKKKNIKRLEREIQLLREELTALFRRVGRLESLILPFGQTKRPNPYEAPVEPLLKHTKWECSAEEAPPVSMTDPLKEELMGNMTPWDTLSWERQYSNHPVEVKEGEEESNLVETNEGPMSLEELQKRFCEQVDKNSQSYFAAGGENWPMGDALKVDSEARSES